MERNDLSRIARDFGRLSKRFEGYAKRARKASHLIVDIQQSAVRAGRLLIVAIDAGAFPKHLKGSNGDWWDRSIGRVPGNVLAVWGFPRWKKGDPLPHRQSEYLAAAGKPFEPEQFLKCWACDFSREQTFRNPQGPARVLRRRAASYGRR